MCGNESYAVGGANARELSFRSPSTPAFPKSPILTRQGGWMDIQWFLSAQETKAIGNLGRDSCNSKASTQPIFNDPAVSPWTEEEWSILIGRGGHFGGTVQSREPRKGGAVLSDSPIHRAQQNGLFLASTGAVVCLKITLEDCMAMLGEHHSLFLRRFAA